MLSIPTPDGAAEAYLAGESGPGVVLFIDAFGLRAQIQAMADRIASWGYVVLVPNVMYRAGTVQELAPTVDLRDPGARDAFVQVAFAQRSPAVAADLVRRDFPAYVAEVRRHCSPGPVGVVGYCLGVRLALWAAALDPEIAAVAGFHGGRLATDDPTSPHRGLTSVRAELVFGHATRDASMPPEAVAALGEAALEAGLVITNEVYDAQHGFTMADTGAYDEASAERAMRETRSLFARSLSPAN